MGRALVFICIGVAGCSHAQMQMNAGAVSGSSGGTVVNTSGAAINVQSSGSSAATLIGLGVAAAVVSGAPDPGYGTYGTRYNMNPFMAVTGTAKPPVLAPNRTVSEQDCTQPLVDTSANLKCR